MITLSATPFITEHLKAINENLVERGEGKLSNTQQWFLSFCLLGLLSTQSLCWERFARADLGDEKPGALSKMFIHSKICWEHLLAASLRRLFKEYGIKGGTLVVDDSDRGRSKNTSRIFGVHKAKDKETGGYHCTQNIVLLLLVTSKFTIPVGFRFYCPDPARKAWEGHDKELREKGVAKSKRPPEPLRDPAYPTRHELTTELVNEFKSSFPEIQVKGVQMDAAYFTPTLMSSLREIHSQGMVVTQMRRSQNVISKGDKEISVEKFFSGKKERVAHILIRGGGTQRVTYCSARVTVCSHGRKYLIVALKYEGERDYRYIVCDNLSWRPEDVLEYYSLRWLVETFFEDWKAYEGWARLAYQQGEEGSRRGVILSLLLDHSLLFHPEQKARLECHRPIVSVGSLLG